MACMHILWGSIKSQWQTEISLKHHARLSCHHPSILLPLSFFFFLAEQKQRYLCDPQAPPLGLLILLLVLRIPPSPSPCSSSNLSLKTYFLHLFFSLLTSAPASHGLENHVVSTVAVAWEKKREVCVRTHFWEVRGQPHTELTHLWSTPHFWFLKILYENCTTAVRKCKQRALWNSVLWGGKVWDLQISISSTSMGAPTAWLSSTRTARVCVRASSAPPLIVRPVNDKSTWFGVVEKKGGNYCLVLKKEMNDIWGKGDDL